MAALHRIIGCKRVGRGTAEVLALVDEVDRVQIPGIRLQINEGQVRVGNLTAGGADIIDTAIRASKRFEVVAQGSFVIVRIGLAAFAAQLEVAADGAGRGDILHDGDLMGNARLLVEVVHILRREAVRNQPVL